MSHDDMTILMNRLPSSELCTNANDAMKTFAERRTDPIKSDYNLQGVSSPAQVWMVWMYLLFHPEKYQLSRFWGQLGFNGDLGFDRYFK